MDIAIIEPIGISEKEISQLLAGHTLNFFDSRGWSDNKLVEKINNSSVIALTNRPISEEVITHLDKLKFISVAFAGLDHIALEAAKNKNIPVKNAGGYANTAVSELVFGLMISLARKIPENNVAVRQQGTTNTGSELKNKTLGIIGMGAIGKEVARIGEAFGMNLMIYDRVNGNSLEYVCSQSDFLSLHIPLTEQTRGMISFELLQKMKPTAFLINCARGPIINSEGLIRALKEKIIAGAALDVFDQEPPLPSHYELLNAPNVIATPHIGFNTQEALISKGTIAINNILEWIKEMKS